MLPTRRFIRLGFLLGLALLLCFALAACQAGSLPGLTGALLQVARGPAMPPAPMTPTPPAAAAGQPATATPVAAPDAVTDAGADAMPVALTIAAIDLGAEVTPMGWELVMDGDQITTRWVVPLETLGWAVNSAAAGEPGNVVILGHQALGDALLRPLALGEIAPGQEIRLQAAGGATYLYTVREVSPPIPAIGATADEIARSAAYLAPTADARLTLVSGWPADTTTHRVFVVAEYTGIAP